MTLKEFIENKYKIPIQQYQKRFLEQYEKARKENYAIHTAFLDVAEEMFCEK